MSEGSSNRFFWPQFGHIEVDNLMTLEAYAKFRQSHLSQIIKARQDRSVNLGEHMRLQFENELTLRYQIQEMLRIERIFEAPLIQAEIDTYAPLLPTGCDWSFTLFLQFPQPLHRREALTRLLGVERRVFVQIQGQARVYACADEALAHVNDHSPKTSAVHFLRFAFTREMVHAIKTSAQVRLGCDHEHYSHTSDMSLALLDALAHDFD
jgi:hypothetical protein